MRRVQIKGESNPRLRGDVTAASSNKTLTRTTRDFSQRLAKETTSAPQLKGDEADQGAKNTSTRPQE